MTNTRLLTIAAAAFAALAGLTGCASSFNANVTRFHETLPPPAQGQSFTVVPDNPQNAGSLEFGHYADQVAERLTGLGYARSADPANAQLIVHLDYGVDKGSERIRSSGFGFGPSPFYYGGPRIIRTRRGSYLVGGFYDPFLWGPSWGSGFNDIESYTVYQSQLKLRIDSSGGGRVFEGTSSAPLAQQQADLSRPQSHRRPVRGLPGQEWRGRQGDDRARAEEEGLGHSLFPGAGRGPSGKVVVDPGLRRGDD